MLKLKNSLITVHNNNNNKNNAELQDTKKINMKVLYTENKMERQRNFIFTQNKNLIAGNMSNNLFLPVNSSSPNLLQPRINLFLVQSFPGTEDDAGASRPIVIGRF